MTSSHFEIGVIVDKKILCNRQFCLEVPWISFKKVVFLL